MDDDKKVAEVHVPEHETKSIDVEVARGSYVKYKNWRTGETKIVREGQEELDKGWRKI